MRVQKELREQLARLISWPDAHITFDDAVARFPVAARGRVPKGLPYSAWQLVEHMRLAQEDILDFCVNPRYREKHWPDDYWPKSPKPPTSRAWSASIAAFKRDRRRLERLARDPRRDLLARIPAGTGQTLLREIVLTADHNAYHIGQIIAVRRLLGRWRAP